MGVGAGFLADVGAAVTASTLMRFTTAASVCFFVGLVVAQPVSGFRSLDLPLVGRIRRRLKPRPVEVEAPEAVTGTAPGA
jgi:hypothetical protein